MTVKVGDTFRDSYADGYLNFTVIEVTGKFILAESDNDPDWGVVEKAYTVRQAEGLIGWSRDEDARTRKHADFWKDLVADQVIHYHNGFGEWVRGVVVVVNGERRLQPTALVGKWNDGTWPYYWAMIKRGNGAWQPNVGNVYESGEWGRGDSHGDPRTMESLDFTDREAGNSYFEHCLQRADA